MSLAVRKNYPHRCDPVCDQCRKRLNLGMPRFDEEPLKPPLKAADGRMVEQHPMLDEENELRVLLPEGAILMETNLAPPPLAYETNLRTQHPKRGVALRHAAPCMGRTLVEISGDRETVQLVCEECGASLGRGRAKQS